MSTAYTLTIDLPRITRNFNATDSRGWTEPQVIEWVAEEISLDVLDRSEYRVLKRL